MEAVRGLQAPALQARAGAEAAPEEVEVLQGILMALLVAALLVAVLLEVLLAVLRVGPQVTRLILAMSVPR